MIYKDIRSMTANESYTVEQNYPILRVIGKYNQYAPSNNVYPLNKPRIIIGRGKASDIMLEDMLVSVRHVCLWFEDNEWHIKDMHSKNGTHLNGQLISESYLLDDGDVIRVGEIELEYKV
jgi:pSer/pThr/pTyr-binding forkhead associated (FHA) protein